MKTSYRKLILFNQVAGLYLAKKPDETKMKYAIERVTSQLTGIVDKMNVKMADIDIDYCSVDKEDNILRDDQDRLRFTKENLKKRNEAQQVALDEESIEIEPYFCTQVPDDLTVQQLEIFTGLVIRPRENTDESNHFDLGTGSDNAGANSAVAS